MCLVVNIFAMWVIYAFFSKNVTTEVLPLAVRPMASQTKNHSNPKSLVMSFIKVMNEIIFFYLKRFGKQIVIIIISVYLRLIGIGVSL